jgi:hypothetical protein
MILNDSESTMTLFFFWLLVVVFTARKILIFFIIRLGSDDALIDIITDNSRNILYTLSERSVIQVRLIDWLNGSEC